MSFRYIVGAAVLAASLPQLALSATCLPYAPTSFPATGTCVSVSAVTISGSVATVGVPSPPLGGPSSGPSASSVLAGGVGVEAKASASASGGLVRLTAFASDGGGDATSSASDRAAAGFSDLGPILLPGALPGAPIHGMVTMEIDGTHTGYAGLGSAYPHLNVAWTTAAGDFGGSFYNIDRPENGGYEFDSFVGDNIFVSLGLEVFADAVPGHPFEFAHYGNTARLFIDFASPDAFVDAVSGHDYRSGPQVFSPVPVPASLPLLLTGLAALLFGRSPRSRSRRS